MNNDNGCKAQECIEDHKSTKESTSECKIQECKDYDTKQPEGKQPVVEKEPGGLKATDNDTLAILTQQIQEQREKKKIAELEKQLEEKERKLSEIAYKAVPRTNTSTIGSILPKRSFRLEYSKDKRVMDEFYKKIKKFVDDTTLDIKSIRIDEMVKRIITTAEQSVSKKNKQLSENQSNEIAKVTKDYNEKINKQSNEEDKATLRKKMESIIKDINQKYADKQLHLGDVSEAEAKGIANLICYTYKRLSNYNKTFFRLCSQYARSFMIPRIRYMNSYIKDCDQQIDYIRQRSVGLVNSSMETEFKMDPQLMRAIEVLQDDRQRCIETQKRYVSEITDLTTGFFTSHQELRIGSHIFDFKDYGENVAFLIRKVNFMKGNLAQYTLLDKNVSNCQDNYSKQLVDMEAKLMSIYNLDYSIMDVVMDSQFIMLYVLKIVHYGILVGALFLTEKIFSEMYMKKVYAENKDPPNIYIMLGILIAIDTGFFLFLITILFLISYIATHLRIHTAIDNEFIVMLIKDFAFFMFFLFIVIFIIAAIVEKKKYFRYKTEGLRAIRALKEIIMTTGAVFTLVPYFRILS